MKTKKRITTIIASVLLVLVILIAGVLPLIGGNRALGITPIRGDRPTGQFSGNPPEGFTPPDGTNFQPGTRRGNLAQGGNLTGSENFTMDSTTLARMQTAAKLNQLIQYVSAGAILLFGVLGIVGLWLSKKWGVVMSIIASVIVLAATIPGMFRFMIGYTLIETIIKLVLAVGVIVLVLIPKPKAEDIPVTI